jgi:ABC-type uncharacterized transport system permease subunit
MPVSFASIVAILAVIPASIQSRRATAGSKLFWPLLLVAGAGVALPAFRLLVGNEFAGLGGALTMSNAATLLLFILCALIWPAARGLSVLLLPYCLCLAVLAAISFRPHLEAAVPSNPVWLDAHILVSILTYGLATIAGIAAFAIFQQERALKRRQPSPLSAGLPAIADTERLQNRLLWLSAIVLAAGLLTGVGTLYSETGQLFTFTHKTIFAVAAFAVIVALLIVHNLTGLRGRRAARIVLVIYLLLTLAYPGVKFVQDILIG